MLQVDSSFLVMHKVGYVGTFVLITLENKTNRKIISITIQSIMTNVNLL